jgi:hypothetical protein
MVEDNTSNSKKLFKYCIDRNKENGFIVFPSHNTIVQNYPVFWKLCNLW